MLFCNKEQRWPHSKDVDPGHYQGRLTSSDMSLRLPGGANEGDAQQMESVWAPGRQSARMTLAVSSLPSEIGEVEFEFVRDTE